MRITGERLKKIFQKLGCEERLSDLFLYADDPANLDPQRCSALEAHLLTCECCRKELESAHAWLEKSSREKIPQWVAELSSSAGSAPGLARRAKERALAWISQPWRPTFAGVQVTASDVSDQVHLFKAPEGEIRVSCRWGGRQGKKPAYVCLAWNANIRKERELMVRFADPDTGEIMAEVSLGSGLEGEAIINSKRLGFDPSTTPWSMYLVLD